MWRATINVAGYIRGLDDITLERAKYLAAATQNGYVQLFDASGKSRWNYYLREPLRRLRAYDLNADGNRALIIGGGRGKLVILDAATGKELKSIALGQAITEVRDAERRVSSSSAAKRAPGGRIAASASHCGLARCLKK